MKNFSGSEIFASVLIRFLCWLFNIFALIKSLFICYKCGLSFVFECFHDVNRRLVGRDTMGDPVIRPLPGSSAWMTSREEEDPGSDVIE